MTEEDEIIEVLYHYQSELSDGFSHYTDGETLTNLARDIARIFTESKDSGGFRGLEVQSEPMRGVIKGEVV